MSGRIAVSTRGPQGTTGATGTTGTTGTTGATGPAGPKTGAVRILTRSMYR